MDGDGIELSSVDGATAYFDVDLNGFAEATGWVAVDDGLLALDLDGDGRIDDGSELFGDQAGHAHGFLAMAVHDDNDDGVIDASDAVFSELVIWQDFNADGISQADEMRGLVEVGISSISTDATDTSYWVAGNEIRYESTFTWTDGTIGTVGDAFFEGDAIRTVAVLPEDFEYHPDVFRLPVLAGAGSLMSTLVALSQDDALRQQAIDLVAQASSGDIAGFKAAFMEFVYAWAGVEDRNWDHIDPSLRQADIDARDLGVLEVIFDQEFQQYYGPGGYWMPYPINGVANDLEAGLNAAIDAMAYQFLSQVAVSDALLNSTDAASYEARLAANPLSLLSATYEVAEVFPRIVSEFDAGELLMIDALALLGIMRDASGDDAAFEAALAQSVINAASGSAELIEQLFTSGPTNFVTVAAGEGTITGTAFSETYLHATGDGTHTIEDYSTQSNMIDRLVLTDFNADDVTFGQNAGGDLVMTAGAETITVTDHFSNWTYSIEEIAFADGTVLDLAGITAKEDSDSLFV